MTWIWIWDACTLEFRCRRVIKETSIQHVSDNWKFNWKKKQKQKQKQQFSLNILFAWSNISTGSLVIVIFIINTWNVCVFFSCFHYRCVRLVVWVIQVIGWQVFDFHGFKLMLSINTFFIGNAIFGAEKKKNECNELSKTYRENLSPIKTRRECSKWNFN